MNVTAYDLAHRYLGMREIPGVEHHPQILAWFGIDGHAWAQESGDETPWCSAFCTAPFWQLGLPRSASLRARSWLQVGLEIDLTQARQGFDVVILKRGGPDQPGPEVLEAPGHVGLFALYVPGTVYLLGGNQSNSVSVQGYPADRVLGVRRMRSE